MTFLIRNENPLKFLVSFHKILKSSLSKKTRLGNNTTQVLSIFFIFRDVRAIVDGFPHPNLIQFESSIQYFMLRFTKEIQNIANEK